MSFVFNPIYRSIQRGLNVVAKATEMGLNKCPPERLTLLKNAALACSFVSLVGAWHRSSLLLGAVSLCSGFVSYRAHNSPLRRLAILKAEILADFPKKGETTKQRAGLLKIQALFKSNKSELAPYKNAIVDMFSAIKKADISAFQKVELKPLDPNAQVGALFQQLVEATAQSIPEREKTEEAMIKEVAKLSKHKAKLSPRRAKDLEGLQMILNKSIAGNAIDTPSLALAACVMNKKLRAGLMDLGFASVVIRDMFRTRSLSYFETEFKEALASIKQHIETYWDENALGPRPDLSNPSIQPAERRFFSSNSVPRSSLVFRRTEHLT